MGHFYFVRHGQTIWNVENKICGATDIALTKKGHEQAMQTGEKILADKLEADEILYSPLMRAADTAKHIAKITRNTGTHGAKTERTEFRKMGVNTKRWCRVSKSKNAIS